MRSWITSAAALLAPSRHDAVWIELISARHIPSPTTSSSLHPILLILDNLHCFFPSIHIAADATTDNGLLHNPSTSVVFDLYWTDCLWILRETSLKFKDIPLHWLLSSLTFVEFYDNYCLSLTVYNGARQEILWFELHTNCMINILLILSTWTPKQLSRFVQNILSSETHYPCYVALVWLLILFQ